MINIMNIKTTGLENICNMALKAHQYNVEHNTDVSGILRCKNHEYIIECNRWKLQSRSKSSVDQEFSFITV